MTRTAEGPALEVPGYYPQADYFVSEEVPLGLKDGNHSLFLSPGGAFPVFG